MRPRILLLVAATTLVAGGAAWVVRKTDSSPLLKMPANLAIRRDVPYGPLGHQGLDLIHEPGRPGPRPAILMIHPGGWMMGDKSTYHRLMIEYAQLGYVSVGVNFRPSGVAKFPAAFDDCRLALRWLRANAASCGVDPARIGVTGWSSGAHLAMLLALADGEPAERVQAAVGFAGVYDFLMERQGAFPNRDDDAAVVQFLGSTPRRNPELARRASPLTHLSLDDPPLLIFHGERDSRIDAEQARHFATTSTSLGRRDDVVLLPDVDHGRDVLPGDPESRRRVREFFARHLRNSAPGAGVRFP